MTFSKILIYIECFLLLVMVVGLAGQRFQFLPFSIAFSGFALAMLIAAAAGLVALIVLLLSFGPVSSEARPLAGLALLIGIVPMVVVVLRVGAGFSVPRIHDISTNTADVIAFEHSQSLRKAGENSLDLPSAEVIDLQNAHYTLAPIRSDQAPADAYQHALTVAESLGWTVAYQNADQSQFEAYEKTALFGFVDDIAVRVKATDEGSVIDLRSVSRVGLSDLGANAKRITRFQAAFGDQQ